MTPFLTRAATRTGRVRCSNARRANYDNRARSRIRKRRSRCRGPSCRRCEETLEDIDPEKTLVREDWESTVIRRVAPACRGCPERSRRRLGRGHGTIRLGERRSAALVARAAARQRIDALESVLLGRLLRVRRVPTSNPARAAARRATPDRCLAIRIKFCPNVTPFSCRSKRN